MNKVVAITNKQSGVIRSALQIVSVLFCIALFAVAYMIYEELRVGKENIKNSESICKSIASGSVVTEFISKAQESNIKYFPPSNVQPKHTLVFKGGFMQTAYCFVTANGNTVVSTEFEVLAQ